MKLIHPGILKFRNEYERAKERYEIRIKQEKRCQEKRLAQPKDATKESGRSL